MMEDISILDMPSEVLLKIFLMVEGEFSLHPFLDMKEGTTTRQLKISNKSNKEIKNYISMFRPWLYPESVFSNVLENGRWVLKKNLTTSDLRYLRWADINPCKLLPNSLCILSRVCKDFKNEIEVGPYWETLYIRDFRNGKKYVHKKKQEIYKQKYYKLINDYFRMLKENLLYHIDLLEKSLMVKNNNAVIYLDAIKNIVRTSAIDIPNLHFRVQNLQQTFRDSNNNIDIRLVELSKPIEQLINYRRICNKEISEFNEELTKINDYYDKRKTIFDNI